MLFKEPTILTSLLGATFAPRPELVARHPALTCG
jgi:hypothetical protein